jgi:hypothetical protein
LAESSKDNCTERIMIAKVNVFFIFLFSLYLLALPVMEIFSNYSNLNFKSYAHLVAKRKKEK